MFACCYARLPIPNLYRFFSFLYFFFLFVADQIAKTEGTITEYTGREVEELVGRVKYKKSFAYEVKWKGFKDTQNSWLSAVELMKMGGSKLIQQCDEKLRVIASGMAERPLDNDEVTAHLGDFGLDKGYCKGACKQLSGGQRSR